MGPWADVLFKVPPTSFILNIFISTLSLESNFKVTCFLWLIGWYLRTAGTAAMTWFEARIVLNANLYQTNASKLYFIIINFQRFLPLPQAVIKEFLMPQVKSSHCPGWLNVLASISCFVGLWRQTVLLWFFHQSCWLILLSEKRIEDWAGQIKLITMKKSFIKQISLIDHFLVKQASSAL